MFISEKQYNRLVELNKSMKENCDRLEDLQARTARLALEYLRKIEDLEEENARLKNQLSGQ